jgi:hypothetical protein
MARCIPGLAHVEPYAAVVERRDGAAHKAVLEALPLPPGTSFRLALTHAIDTATDAAGDLVRAELTSPITENRNGLIVPKGAAVIGRIVQIKRAYGPKSESLTLGL